MNVTAVPSPPTIADPEAPVPTGAQKKGESETKTKQKKTKQKKTKDGQEEGKKGGKKKLVLIALLLAVAAGGTSYALKGPSGPEVPKPGAVVTLEPIQINLASQHYLRIGIAMQMTDKAEAEIDGSKALDATIAEFSGKGIAEVNQPKVRRTLKEHLLKELETRYDDEVMEVYFTEFVTQ